MSDAQYHDMSNDHQPKGADSYLAFFLILVSVGTVIVLEAGSHARLEESERLYSTQPHNADLEKNRTRTSSAPLALLPGEMLERFVSVRDEGELVSRSRDVRPGYLSRVFSSTQGERVELVVIDTGAMGERERTYDEAEAELSNHPLIHMDNGTSTVLVSRRFRVDVRADAWDAARRSAVLDELVDLDELEALARASSGA